MIYVIEYLLENKEARQIMDKNPMLAILIPHLRQARDLLANTRDTPQIILSPGQEMAIRQNLRKYDDEHDQANRIFEGLLALASRSTNDENVRAKADGVKASLLPYGLNVTRMKYVDEAGEASRLAKQIEDKEVADYLKSIEFKAHGINYNALEQANKIVKLGKEMHGCLLKLENKEAATSSPQTARNTFFRVIKQLKHSAEFSLSDQPKALEVLLSVLEESITSATPTPQPKQEEHPSPTENPSTPSVS
ncbi:MAG TPA: hypothetical protein DCE42_10365 [Myxococcales bacterium]|nr:hypothetical protein [Deltaproteobacteria bacterium]MBU54796.1 hypothetical protein [Deltaproteobacteria bacterium]HAA55152.1 hypothetical protein [Myxococcales bacterium]|tara:strand:- start:3104 stop:3853 length:750 start_codon:yes stop_codon:yes gene_type:complete